MVSSGGAENVYAGASDSGTTVNSKGVEQVLAGGVAQGAQIAGGTLQLFGSATGTVVSSGGMENVFSGGNDSGATIGANGAEQVWGGGIAQGVQIDSGGAQYIYSGGSAVATTVSSGGYEQVFGGGTIDGATISGGKLEFSSGGTAGSSTITFVDSGTLRLDTAQAYGMLVAGFVTSADVIDFSKVAFASATESFLEDGSNLSGTLTVTDGTDTASVVLLGNYTAAIFTLSKESGTGTGTLVTDPPSDAGSTGLVTPHSPST